MNQLTATLTGAQTTSILTAAGLVGANPRPEVGDYILITTGAGLGQVRRILAYDANTGQMTLDIPLLLAPAAGDMIRITKAATASVTLTFASPLPDDRYTLTVKDNLVDPAGNRLDGESNAHGAARHRRSSPRGDGVPGGSFSARFTVDSRPEIGSYVSQNINIDINGNVVWDPASGPDRRRLDARRHQLDAAGEECRRLDRSGRLQRARPVVRRQVPAANVYAARRPRRTAPCSDRSFSTSWRRSAIRPRKAASSAGSSTPIATAS